MLHIAAGVALGIIAANVITKSYNAWRRQQRQRAADRFLHPDLSAYARRDAAKAKQSSSPVRLGHS